MIKNDEFKKGNVINVAMIAGIMGAKQTSNLIPLCHNISLESSEIKFRFLEEGLEIVSIVQSEEKTGVEMEALTAVTISALTIYDMVKGVDKSVYIKNISLLEKKGGKTCDYKKIKELTEAHLGKLKINVKSADQKVEELSGGQRQAVAIARATAFNAKIVLMDEPTAALAVKEVGKVLDLILNLKKLGVSVIVISHRMDDIFTVCDRVMALFQGTNFAESELQNTSRDEVIGWIMGKKD